MGIDPPAAVLWDLDGTIVDSQLFHWLAWKQTLGQMKVEISREQFLHTFGQKNATFLPGWLGPGASVEEICEVSERKEACFRRLICEAGLTALPGAPTWIERLSREGWRLAVASSAPRLNVEAMLEAVGLRRYFAAIVAAEDVRLGKPDPEVFLVAAARLSTPPGRAVVIEDSPAGIEAACRAEMPSIGVGLNSLPGATLQVRSLEELPAGALEELIAGNGAAENTNSHPGRARVGVDSLKIP